MRQLLLQLVVKREALGTVLRSRSEDIGQSSVNTLSSNLSYNFGVYNNQLRNGGSNTSSYLSLNNVTALREHHVVLDGSLYGIGSGQQDSELYKAMYERDFAGHRFAGGMLDTWNLQSLGPMTAISAGRFTAFPGKPGQLHHLRQQPVSHASDRLYRRRAKYISPVMGGY